MTGRSPSAFGDATIMTDCVCSSNPKSEDIFCAAAGDGGQRRRCACACGVWVWVWVWVWAWVWVWVAMGVRGLLFFGLIGRPHVHGCCGEAPKQALRSVIVPPRHFDLRENYCMALSTSIAIARLCCACELLQWRVNAVTMAYLYPRLLFLRLQEGALRWSFCGNHLVGRRLARSQDHPP